MNKPLKQILMGATVVAFTACGGGGGGTAGEETNSGGTTTGAGTNAGGGGTTGGGINTGGGISGGTSGGGTGSGDVQNHYEEKIRLTKMTYIHTDDGSTAETTYTYEDDDKGRLYIFTTKNYKNGIYKDKVVKTSTYEGDSDMPSKEVSESYDASDKLLFRYTADFEYNSDKFITKFTSKTEDMQNPENDGISITERSDYEGPVAKKEIHSSYDLNGNIKSTTTTIKTAHDEKVTRSEYEAKDSQESLVAQRIYTYSYDKKHRLIEQKTTDKDTANGHEKTDTAKYTNDIKNRTDPWYPCFGKSRKILNRYYQKYPKMQRGCALVTKRNYTHSHKTIEYLYEFNDKNLVIKKREKVDSILKPYYTTYEYENIEEKE